MNLVSDLCSHCSVLRLSYLQVDCEHSKGRDSAAPQLPLPTPTPQCPGRKPPSLFTKSKSFPTD